MVRWATDMRSVEIIFIICGGIRATEDGGNEFTAPV